MNDLQGKVNTVPEIEAKLKSLNRDYDALHEQYQELVQRRETASLSQDVDRSGTVKFETIEPPSAAFEPVSPNRPRLLVMALVAGLGLAGGLAWLLNQLNPVFHSAKSLEEITGLSVLASVSRTWLQRHRHGRRLEVLRFSAIAILLVATFGAATLLQQPAANLMQRLMG